MKPVNTHNNFIFLTIALVILLLTSAVGHELPGNIYDYVYQLVMLGTFAVAYVSLNFGPRWHPFVATVLVLTVLVNIADSMIYWPGLDLVNQLLGLVFFGGAAYNAGRQVLLSNEVGPNIIFGSLAIYLLMGLIWASLYMIVLYFNPAAFVGIQPVAGENSYSSIVYFSYVTLATLGYGDISPAIPLSRVLAYLEAIAGTFYLAIVVASLVGARRKGGHS